MNLLSVLLVENYNLAVSLKKIKKEFEYFEKLDCIYIEYLGLINKVKLNSGNEEPIIISLYLFVHYHYYITFSLFLRQHLSDAMSSLRKAIDGAFTAYYIIEDPKSVYEYLEGENKFINIKRTIKEIRSRDQNKFILGKDLILYHEECSEYGSHADVSSFIHRLEVDDTKNIKRLSFNYFQIFKNEDEFKFRFIIFLMGFLIIFKIFKIFLDSKLKGLIIPKLEGDLANLEEELKVLGKRYKKKIQE